MPVPRFHVHVATGRLAAPASGIRHVSGHPNRLSTVDALAGGTTHPGVAESIEGRPQRDDVAVVDPAGLQAG